MSEEPRDIPSDRTSVHGLLLRVKEWMGGAAEMVMEGPLRDFHASLLYLEIMYKIQGNTGSNW